MAQTTAAVMHAGFMRERLLPLWSPRREGSQQCETLLLSSIGQGTLRVAIVGGQALPRQGAAAVAFQVEPPVFGAPFSSATREDGFGTGRLHDTEAGAGANWLTRLTRRVRRFLPS